MKRIKRALDLLRSIIDFLKAVADFFDDADDDEKKKGSR